jgi:hypothetical protein
VTRSTLAGFAVAVVAVIVKPNTAAVIVVFRVVMTRVSKTNREVSAV